MRRLELNDVDAVALIERERHVLAQIASGLSLSQVLDELLRAVEGQKGRPLLASILFVSEDGRFLRHGAGPSLPVAYNEAVDGIAVGEGQGSCGTAITRGEPVYANDIATDPLWKDFRDLALHHGLRACWSTPIKASDGRILGTFAIYYRETRAPSPADLGAIAFVTQTAALAIERHRSDQALRASQDELRRLAGTLERQVEARTQERDRAWRLSQDLLVVARTDGTMETVNAAWTRLLGWEGSDLLDAPFADFTHPEDLEATMTAFRGILERPLTEPFEYRFRHKDGSYRWFAWTGAFEDGRVYASGRHVTVEREQAEALRQSQKMEAVGQLTGGVAHDFNNLLTVIKSSTDLLKRPDLTEERRNRYVGAISDTVDRAARLTAQLLAFARRQALRPEVFEVGQAVRMLGDMMGTLTGSRIEIVTDLSAEASFINSDPSQFDTALVNIVVNARDAMGGEGRIRVGVRQVEVMPAIRAHAAVQAAYVAVSIADTGSGITDDHLDKIFEPFFTTKGVGQGTGLGLSQVYGFAKQSGGEVMVESRAGYGTIFTLYLPQVATPEPATEATVAEPSVDGHGTCVLVVEDNVDVGTFATQTLAELGYGTVWATNADEALAELAKDASRFDVVFSDVVMPGMNGIDLGHEIRRLHHDLPVILTSGYSHVLAQNGTYGFELLHKPYSVEQLSRILRKAATWKRRMGIIGR